MRCLNLSSRGRDKAREKVPCCMVKKARVEAGKAIQHFASCLYSCSIRLFHRSSNTMFFAAIFLIGLCVANGINFTTVYQWEKFDFIWPSGADTSIGQMKDEYKPGNVYLSYMAVFGERLFLSLDLEYGIPATLVWLPTSDTSTAPPKLAPFPSWHLHKKDNCETIQQAKGLETDPDGRLWVVDDGSNSCPGKVWIFNLLKNDNTELFHQFPDTVVSHSYSKRALRNIVLDKTTDGYLAYIADSESEHIIVYSRITEKSWSVKTPGRKWRSLALSANREARQLYLGRFKSNELYSVSVSELRNEGESAAVKLIGKWTEYNPYRMVIDSGNVLYAAFWSQNYLSKWNISEPFREQRFHEVGKLHAYWPFTFALDTNGTFWMTETNETGGGIRHKLLKAAVGASSYLFSTSTALTTPQATLIQETSEVMKSTQMPTSKTGTHQPALKSNKTSDCCAGLAKSQSLNTILIWSLVCCFSCLVLSGAVILWLTLRMRRMQTSSRQIPMDNRAEIPDDPVYDDVAPENSEPGIPENNPVEPLYSEVDPDYASARNPSSEPYEVPLHLMGKAKAGKPSEPVYDDVGPTEPDHMYDDVGPGPSSGPSRNKKSERKPAESVQYLKVLP